MRKPLPRVRSSESSVIEAQARCSDCEFSVDAKNAIGLGNIHARRSGHTVICAQTIGVIYNA